MADEYLAVKQLNCCGVIEINGILSFSKPDAVIKTLLQRRARFGCTGSTDTWGYKRPAYTGISGTVIFTTASTHTGPVEYGERLAHYIEQEGLGRVTRTQQPAINHNTKNYINVYVWQVNEAQLLNWKGKHCGTKTSKRRSS